MNYSMRRLGLILWFLFALSGCETLFGRQGLPPDPLFVNRKPIESKAKSRPPQELPFTEPTPPPNPFASVP